LCYYRFSYYVSLGFVFCFLRFFHFFLSTSREIVWVERPQNDLFCIERDIKHLLNQSLPWMTSRPSGCLPFLFTGFLQPCMRYSWFLSAIDRTLISHCELRIGLIASAGGESCHLDAGDHRYPFTFSLPANVPSSFEGMYGSVRYTAHATIERPWKFNHNTRSALTVISLVDLNLEPPELKVIYLQSVALNETPTYFCP